MTEETKFTVFATGIHQGNDYPHWRRLSLQEFISDLQARFSGFAMDAWAPEWISGEGGGKDRDTLRAESIAAGRVIELVDGKYVARGVEAEWVQRAKARVQANRDADQTYERRRPPLDWADSKSFDAFPGFQVSTDCAAEPLTNGRSIGKFRSPDLA